MSYLHPIRLHFAGRFRADVSTINNVRARFDSDRFEDRFTLPLSGANDRNNWQPAGTGAWRILDCRVTRACRSDGSSASTPAEDSVVGAAVREAGDRSSSKIVDLDPDQQGVSMIFGLIVRLVDDRGQTLVQGEFEPTAFFDLQFDRLPGGGVGGASAYFQSILRNVEWGDVANSPCLEQMRHASVAGSLSIKFITDGYLTSEPQRGYGRLAGTIGPYIAGEPRRFVMGRHLAPDNRPFAHAVCRVDAERRKVFVDVGNSLPMESADGDDFADSGDITLAISGAGGSSLGSLDYRASRSYALTAGIYELPVGRTLTDSELAALAQSPLHLMASTNGPSAAIARESADGIYVRAEQFVFRLDPGATERTDLIVSKFGAPLSGATIVTQALPFSVPESSPLPDLATTPQSDAGGRIALTIKANGPPFPRRFIDGQVYAVAFAVEGAAQDPSDFDDANVISLLAFSPIPTLAEPTWKDAHPILVQYSNLYPRPHGRDPYTPFAGRPPSHPIVDLDKYESVTAFSRHILKALELPIDHPNHMPVTRDLSNAKRSLLLKWLREVDADGKPKRDAESPAAAAASDATPETAPAKSALRYAATVFELPEDFIRRKQSSQN